MDKKEILYCKICGERGNTVPYSMANEHHFYGPTTHDFIGVPYEQLHQSLKIIRNYQDE